jgi:hypothetical protein
MTHSVTPSLCHLLTVCSLLHCLTASLLHSFTPSLTKSIFCHLHSLTYFYSLTILEFSSTSPSYSRTHSLTHFLASCKRSEMSGPSSHVCAHTNRAEAAPPSRRSVRRPFHHQPGAVIVCVAVTHHYRSS